MSATAPIIHIAGLGKRYRLGETTRYRTLRETWQGWFTRRRPVADRREFWALRDVCFDVDEGEVVGVIGRNGAGKSTLLRILARITHPTTGGVDIRGRVGSLLEVGTGFHPELTGRENIFLNGAILGMTRREMRGKLDAIVDFAEIDQFLDTPVKRYSSGMYVRLAFAVAAHLEPEVLLVDEVLAVGDIAFQKKCLGKMSDLTGAGHTVLFVTHQMPMVQALCTRAIWLDDGGIRLDGEVAAVLDAYFADISGEQATDLATRRERTGSGRLRFVQAGCEVEQGASASALVSGRDGRIVLHVRNDTGAALRNVRVGISIDTALGQRLTTLSNDMANGALDVMHPGTSRVEMVLPRTPFAPGEYLLTLFCAVGDEVADWIQHAVRLRIEAGDYFGNGRVLQTGMGVLYLPYRVAVSGP